MRKLYILLTVLVIAILADFSMWFIQTKAITNAIYTLKKEMGVQGLVLSYEDISFKNFLAWKVKGQITQPKIFRGHREAAETIMLDKIEIMVQPFSNLATFYISKNIKLIISGKDQSHEYLYKFAKKPVVKINMKHSLMDLMESLSSKQSIFEQLKSLQLQTDKLEIFSLIPDTQRVVFLDEMKLELENIRNKDPNKVHLSILFNGIRYDKDYTVKNNTWQKLHDLYVELGASNIEMDVSFSTIKKELNKKVEKKNVLADINSGHKIKNVDASIININKVNVSNDKFALLINGAIEKQLYDPFPFVDLQIKLKNYKDLVRYNAAYYNSIIHNAGNSPVVRLAPKLKPEQIEKLIDLVSELGYTSSPEDILITITRSEKENLNISDRSINFLLHGLRSIFVEDGQKEEEQQGVMQQRDEQRGAKQPKD